MARGIVAMDRVAQGQRHVQITRMDGNPVDEAEWVAELRIPEDARLAQARWQDDTIPGCWHLMLVWWVVPASCLLPVEERKAEGDEHG